MIVTRARVIAVNTVHCVQQPRLMGRSMGRGGCEVRGVLVLWKESLAMAMIVGGGTDAVGLETWCLDEVGTTAWKWA